jgi:hypothetical protein
MKGEIKASISAIAAAAMLVACASKSPASSTGLTPAGSQDPTSVEYQRLIDNAGRQQLLCQREQVLGSRIASQVCLTRAQMEEQRKEADDLVRDIRTRDAINRQQIPDRPPMPQPAPRSPQ